MHSNGSYILNSFQRLRYKEINTEIAVEFSIIIILNALILSKILEFAGASWKIRDCALTYFKPARFNFVNYSSPDENTNFHC